jgi:hypothetical protein
MCDDKNIIIFVLCFYVFMLSLYVGLRWIYPALLFRKDTIVCNKNFDKLMVSVILMQFTAWRTVVYVREKLKLLEQ